MAGLFPRIAEKCNPSVATSCCSGRRDAVRSGRYYWDLERDGWVDRELPLRTMKNWEVIYKAGKDTRDEPYILERCGFCSCELPQLFKHRGDARP